MHHHYDIVEKQIAVRDGATLNDLFISDEILPDEGLRYRYVCRCGRNGAWRRDPNLAHEAAESHVSAAYDRWLKGR